MRTKTVIKALNHAYLCGHITSPRYIQNIEATLQGMDEQKQIQFRNMTLA